MLLSIHLQIKIILFTTFSIIMGTVSPSLRIGEDPAKDKINAGSYDSLDEKIKNTLMKQNRIVKMMKTSAPLNAVGLVNHHEIIFQLDEFLIVVSWTESGIEVRRGFTLKQLLQQRQENKIVETISESIKSTQQLGEHIKDLMKKSYNLYTWNCQHFATQLMKRMKK